MLPILFTRDWYVAVETPGMEKPATGPHTLPRDMMILEKRDPDCINGNSTGYHPGGRYRYSKTFDAPVDWKSKSVTVEFESVYHRSTIIVNGQIAGGRANGYLPIFVNLDPFLKYGASNTIEVIADTTEEPTSRWYTGSGIYRPVHLHIGPKAGYIKPLGLKVHTLSLDARLSITVDVASPHTTGLYVELELFSGNKAIPMVQERSEHVLVPSNQFRQTVSVPNPKLWSPDEPNLYTLKATLYYNGETLDSVSDDIGILVRTVDSVNGLQINGQTYKLRGACIHSDHGIIGANSLPEAEFRRVRMLKESGYNAIRNSHNPASRDMLRECDRLGVLVMDELADEWQTAKAPFGYNKDYDACWEKDLEDMISWGYNRPSVVMWSIGNEIPETAGEWGVEQTKIMVAKCHALDPTRFTTAAINGLVNMLYGSVDIFSKTRTVEQNENGEWVKKPKAEPKEAGSSVVRANLMMAMFDHVLPYAMTFNFVTKKISPAMDSTDIAGYNYMQSRYYYDVKRYPGRVILGTETHPALTDKIWKDVKQYPAVIGDFAWTAWDYIGEVMLANITYNGGREQSMAYPALASGQSIIDLIGHRQTQSYFNEIIWGQRTRPLLAVGPMDHWNEKFDPTTWRLTDTQQSWSWDGYEGKTAIVEVYSHEPKVELWLNDKKIGTGKTGEYYRFRTIFKVPYMPGKLVAIALDKNGEETGRDELVSAGNDLQLTVVPEKARLSTSGDDLLYLPISLTDKSGKVRPLVTRLVKVNVEGQGQLLGFGSAASHTEESYNHNEHTTYYGRVLAIIRGGHEAGKIRISVSANGCKTVELEIPVGDK